MEYSNISITIKFQLPDTLQRERERERELLVQSSASSVTGYIVIMLLGTIMVGEMPNNQYHACSQLGSFSLSGKQYTCTFRFCSLLYLRNCYAISNMKVEL